jgi:hypothetical protein
MGILFAPEKEKKRKKKKIKNTSNDYADRLKINLMMH